MTRLQFLGFSDYEEGKMGHFNTNGDMKIPLNIFIDNYEEVKDFSDELCRVDICGVSGKFDIYESEEAYMAAETDLATIAMIPSGTFSINSEEKFHPSPNIIFSGIVCSAEKYLSATEEEPNYRITIETLEMELILFVQYDGIVQAGNVVSGMAWLFGDMMPCGNENI